MRLFGGHLVPERDCLVKWGLISRKNKSGIWLLTDKWKTDI